MIIKLDFVWKGQNSFDQVYESEQQSLTSQSETHLNENQLK